MNSVPLILLNSLLNASSNVLDKRLMSSHNANPYICTLSFGIVALPFAVVGLLILPPIPIFYALAAMTSGMLYIIAVHRYYTLVSKEDISRLMPLMRMTSLQILLLSAVFFNELLSSKQFIAFGFMLSSSFILSLKPSSTGNWKLSREALRIIPVTTLLSINSVLLSQVYKATSVWHGETWYDLGIVIAVVVVVIRQRKQQPFHKENKGSWAFLIFEQTIRLITGLISASVIVQGMPVSLLSTIEGVRMIWVWLLAMLFLKERSTGRELIIKMAGMLGMAIGLGCLK